jgi:hypothetical protein
MTRCYCTIRTQFDTHGRTVLLWGSGGLAEKPPAPWIAIGAMAPAGALLVDLVPAAALVRPAFGSHCAASQKI